jgi:hypothetical protein
MIAKSHTPQILKKKKKKKKNLSGCGNDQHFMG